MRYELEKYLDEITTQIGNNKERKGNTTKSYWSLYLITKKKLLKNTTTLKE